MTTATKRAITVGVFETRDAAERAVADLKANGYRDDQIGLVGKDSAAADTAAGAATGAAVGAAGGALVGAGVLAGVLPVIGPVVALGSLGTILLNAAVGAAAVGVAGALTGWGVSDDDANYYEGEVKAGRYIVTVDGTGRADARGVFSRYGGYDRASAPRR